MGYLSPDHVSREYVNQQSSSSRLILFSTTPAHPLQSEDSLSDDVGGLGFIHSSEESSSEIVIKQPVKETQIFSKETISYLVDRSKRLYNVTSRDLIITQSEVTPRHRKILVEWLMEVSDKFQLKRQTFHLSVHYTDSFISKTRDFALDSY